MVETWRHKFKVAEDLVELWSYDDFAQTVDPATQFFDVHLQIKGLRYTTSFLTMAYMANWEEEDILYYPDPSFVIVRKIDKKTIEGSVTQIIKNGELDRFFQTYDGDTENYQEFLENLRSMASEMKQWDDHRNPRASDCLQSLHTWLSDTGGGVNRLTLNRGDVHFWKDVDAILNAAMNYKK